MRSTATIGRRATFVPAVQTKVSWAAVYISTTLIIWTIAPFLRRLADWKTHFSAISPFSALPLIMLVPAAFILISDRARRINKSFEVIALFYVLGFVYALAVAILAGRLLGGLFTFVSFCLPLAFGLWIATRSEDSDVLYRRLSQTSIVLAIVTGVYGIVQWAVVPPWDALWMKGVDLATFGFPIPFQVRVFSMLNSPATLAAFLTFATIMFLPRLTVKTGLVLLPIFIGLGLSSVRAGWITLSVSIVIFACLTTRRKAVLRGVAVFIGAGILAIVLLGPLFSLGVANGLESRLLTLTDIAHDESAENRAGQIANALTIGLTDPEGSGLGFIGVASRLNSADEATSNLDSGYLARFVEMGFPGTIAFLVSLGLALNAAIRAWKRAIRNRDSEGQDMAALAITMQFALLALNLFGDASTGLAAILAWASLGLIVRSPAPKRAYL